MPLTLNGTTGIAGANGSASTPAVQGEDTNTGVFFPAADTVAVATGGSERMRVDSSGNVGIGTSTPSHRFSVYNNINGTPFTWGNATRNGYLYQDTSGVGISDSANTAFTNGLYLNTVVSYAALYTSGAERARIDSGGNLLVGTTTASVTSGQGTKILVDGFNGTADGPVQAWVGNNTASDKYWGMVYSLSNGTYRFYGDYAGNLYARSTSIISLSDARLKENIRDLETGLDEVMALRPRRFDWKEGQGQDKKDVAGFIAQEVEPVLPELVTTGIEEDEAGDKYKMMAPGMLIPTLVKAVQELKAEVDSLKAQLEAAQ
jgi:hypothetical protein